MGTELYNKNTLNKYPLLSVNVLRFICCPMETVKPLLKLYLK
jgi:hypothetical protein